VLDGVQIASYVFFFCYDLVAGADELEATLPGPVQTYAHLMESAAAARTVQNQFNIAAHQGYGHLAPVAPQSKQGYNVYGVDAGASLPMRTPPPRGSAPYYRPSQ
jgi:hypothetical protein